MSYHSQRLGGEKGESLLFQSWQLTPTWIEKNLQSVAAAVVVSAASVVVRVIASLVVVSKTVEDFKMLVNDSIVDLTADDLHGPALTRGLRIIARMNEWARWRDISNDSNTQECNKSQVVSKAYFLLYQQVVQTSQSVRQAGRQSVKLLYPTDMGLQPWQVIALLYTVSIESILGF